jgi:uncharacterized membrane protein
MQKNIFIIFILSFLLLFEARRSFAQETLPKSDKYPENSWIEEIPVVCNYTDTLHSFLESKGWFMYKTYTGRTGAESNGKPVFIVAQYKNVKLPKMIIETITVPSGQSCLFYQGFDEKNTNKKL